MNVMFVVMNGLDVVLFIIPVVQYVVFLQGPIITLKKMPCMVVGPVKRLIIGIEEVPFAFMNTFVGCQFSQPRAILNIIFFVVKSVMNGFDNMLVVDPVVENFIGVIQISSRLILWFVAPRSLVVKVGIYGRMTIELLKVP